jgi:hypothetical protein
MIVEDVPREMVWTVEVLARALTSFGDSVRAAERKGRPIIAMIGEKIPEPKRRKG